MSITFETREQPGYLLLECSGTYSLEEVLRIHEQAFVLAIDAGQQAVLFDARKLTGRAPTMAERYSHAVHVAALQLKQVPRIRLAVLGNEPMIHKERFGQIVATNRGAQVGVFTDEAMALDWLLARTGSP